MPEPRLDDLLPRPLAPGRVSPLGAIREELFAPRPVAAGPDHLRPEPPPPPPGVGGDPFLAGWPPAVPGVVFWGQQHGQAPQLGLSSEAMSLASERVPGGFLFDEPPGAEDGRETEAEESPCRDLTKAEPVSYLVAKGVTGLWDTWTEESENTTAVEEYRGMIRSAVKQNPDAAKKALIRERETMSKELSSDAANTIPRVKTGIQRVIKAIDESLDLTLVVSELRDPLRYLDAVLEDLHEAGDTCDKLLSRLVDWLAGENAKGDCQVLKAHLESAFRKVSSITSSVPGLIASRKVAVLIDTLKSCPVGAADRGLVAGKLADLYKEYRALP